MQTSIEWLVTELNKELNYIPITQWDRIRDIVHKAKEMHYYETKKVCEFWHGKYIPKPIFDEYYSETFKKD